MPHRHVKGEIIACSAVLPDSFQAGNTPVQWRENQTAILALPSDTSIRFVRNSHNFYMTAAVSPSALHTVPL